MDTSVDLLILLAAFLIAMDLVLIGRLMISRLKKKDVFIQSLEYRKLLFEVAVGKIGIKKRKLDSNEYFRMKQVVLLDKSKSDLIEDSIDREKIEQKSLKGLNSRRKIVRLQSVVNLGMLGSEKVRKELEKALLSEEDYTVRIYIANALADIGNSESIPILALSLINANRFYRSKVNMLLTDFGDSLNSYIPLIINNKYFETKELIIDYAGIYYSENTKKFLIDLVNNREEEIEKLSEAYLCGTKCCKNCVNQTIQNDKLYCRYHGAVQPTYHCRRYKVLPVSINPVDNYMQLVYKACEVMSSYYPEVMMQEGYLSSEDVKIKNYAIRALANGSSEHRIITLLALLDDENSARTVVSTIAQIVEKTPRVLLTISEAFYKESNPVRKKEIAKILSGRLEYFILKLERRDKENAGNIIREILLQGRTSEIIDFLNKNKNIDLENELLEIVRSAITINPELKMDFAKYMDERLMNKCELVRMAEKASPRKEKRDKKLTVFLITLLLFCLLIIPAIYLIRYWSILPERPLRFHLEQFVIDFNYYLAYYSAAINLTYLLLLLLSFRHAKEQEKLWKLKNMPLLFKKKMLPSVSIIAPAYNEEKTIIESANSLLNLKYPDYELIFVNDGSKDNTLDTLIKYFNLKRVDYVFDYRLKTKQVRGIYMNRSLPKLIVVDKENGGKADSLNAGINISNKEYFCGIDADSLLEEEALLRLAAMTLDEKTETPALGGNILPINGCEVELGQIKSIRIPDNCLGRLQTVEYIRAFMAGRLGWAKLNSLLIISGAFGLFRKERVISVGGYLTSSGKYEKDTVGEDMELVVRIRRLMKELGLRHRILYSYNANCWTEVPESIKVLKKQRYRWHKGLIDILIFHRKMIFNPNYGRTGMLAMPYFFFFEMIGPIIELEGYLMVILALLLGLLNVQILLLLFICTVLLGILISVSSLVIAEKDIKSFSMKDIMIMMSYAVLENFGPRQFISFWRVGGFFQMFKKSGGWDKAERKGFQTKQK